MFWLGKTNKRSNQNGIMMKFYLASPKYHSSQILGTDKIILLDQNNYTGSNWLLKCQNFLQRCSSYLKLLHNYFDNNPTKLFLVLYLNKCSAISAKSFFPCCHLNFIQSIREISMRDVYRMNLQYKFISALRSFLRHLFER